MLKMQFIFRLLSVGDVSEEMKKLRLVEITFLNLEMVFVIFFNDQNGVFIFQLGKSNISSS